MTAPTIQTKIGVGSGHVIGGEIYRGATGVAGEIGHLAIDPHGEPCVCGLRGCLDPKPSLIDAGVQWGVEALSHPAPSARYHPPRGGNPWTTASKR